MVKHIGSTALLEDVWFDKDAADTVVADNQEGYALLEETDEIAMLAEIFYNKFIMLKTAELRYKLELKFLYYDFRIWYDVKKIELFVEISVSDLWRIPNCMIRAAEYGLIAKCLALRMTICYCI